MNKWMPLVSITVALVSVTDPGYAQFTEAHRYDNAPVGINQIELAYAYTHSNASIYPSLVVAGAKFNLNQGTITYTRYFGFFQRVSWIEASVPLAGLGGSVSGTNIHGSATGVGDSSYAVTALLKGGPALSVAQFDDYKPTTTVGMSFTVTAPTGDYSPNNLLNLGADRRSFKPEIALSQPFGPEQKWQCDIYARAYFFTDNTSFHGTEVLRQQPLPIVRRPPQSTQIAADISMNAHETRMSVGREGKPIATALAATGTHSTAKKKSVSCVISQTENEVTDEAAGRRARGQCIAHHSVADVDELGRIEVANLTIFRSIQEHLLFPRVSQTGAISGAIVGDRLGTNRRMQSSWSPRE